MTLVTGKTISECFALISRVGCELEGLQDTLSNLLVLGLGADKAMPCVVAGDATEDSRTDDSGWVYTDWAWSLPLKASGKGKNRIRQYLGFQISMTGDGMAIPGCLEPLLHVFCWACSIEFQEDYYAKFPLEEVDGNTFGVVDSRLLVWGEPEVADWCARSWMYSLRLTSLNSSHDLKKYVLAPALLLLKGADAMSALPDDWVGNAVIRYPAKEDLLAI